MDHDRYLLSAVLGGYAGSALAPALLRLIDPDILGGSILLIVLFAGTFIAVPASIFMNMLVIKPLVTRWSRHSFWRPGFLPLLGALTGFLAICAATLLLMPLFNAQEPRLESFLGYALFGTCCGFCTALLLHVLSTNADHGESA